MAGTDKRHMAMVESAWDEVTAFAVEVQTEFGFRIDPAKLEGCRRRVLSAFEVQLCKAVVRQKHGGSKPCPYRASKGGYCGLHSKARQRDRDAEIEKRVADGRPRHNHGFGEFCETCPACMASSLTPPSPSSTK